jgi:hypothetical protein
MIRLVFRFAVAACTAASGYLHTDLYLHGYRSIPLVGPAFLRRRNARRPEVSALSLTGDWQP